MENFKKSYELSLWEDVLHFIILQQQTGKEDFTYDLDKIPETTPEEIEAGISRKVVGQYFKETKVAILGSDTMTSPIKANNVKLTRQLNGSYTVSFSLLLQYYDDDSESIVLNPYTSLLQNEKKLKLRVEDSWYDLIIKDIQEDSKSNLFNYMAKAQFINELAKTGFNITLDEKLKNNMGTSIYLAKQILEGTDWTVDEQNSSKLFQYIEEPLYQIKLKEEITAKKIIPQNAEGKQEEEVTIPSTGIIYGFYSSVSEKASTLYFLYTTEYLTDENQIITNADNYYIENVQYIDDIPSFGVNCTFSSAYRGKKIIKKQTTVFEKNIDKYVKEYTDSNGAVIYGFTETSFITPAAVKNFVSNSCDFSSTDGWQISKGSDGSDGELSYETDPSIDTFKPEYNPDGSISVENLIHSFVTAKFPTGGLVLNYGVRDHRSAIKSFFKGEKYIAGLRSGYKSGSSYVNESLNIKVGKYTLKDGIYTINDSDVYFTFSNFQLDTTSDNKDRKFSLYTCTAECQKAITYQELLNNNVGIFLYPSSYDTSKVYYIEELQFFQYKTDADGKVCTIGGDITSGVKTIYKYYDKNANLDKTANEITYLYVGETPCTDYIPKYEHVYEKIRSITAKESTRFNLLQKICETFECWADFYIAHEENGELKYETIEERDAEKKLVSIIKRPIKKVSFKEYIGKDNFTGFKYGINLTSIQRSILSDGFCSKLIVKSNSNIHANHGSCNIAIADENPARENFILDFSHYIYQGMLDFNAINNDLYNSFNSSLGYYKNLRALNGDREQLIEELGQFKIAQDKYTALYNSAHTAVTKAEEQKQSDWIELKTYLCDPSITDWGQLFKPTGGIIDAYKDNEEVKKRLAAIMRLQTTIDAQKKIEASSKKGLEESKTAVDSREEILKGNTKEKVLLNKKFYSKYSRFIQEGSWISEDYIDDNLYYLDSLSTLHAAAQPKVTYTINVIDVSKLEDLEGYKFDLGDKTFIEDTEFFGWNPHSETKTPYQEEIIVTELTEDLDNPQQNQIKVQNFKTQFEDLFQRITEATTTLQYNGGKYGTVVGIVDNNGNIKADNLKNSMANNAFIISNAKNESVIIDDTGITTTNLSDPSKIVRIVSGGIILSNDGGQTWKTGITGDGINATYINTGRLDASMVNIMCGEFPAFRWDKYGLNAYEYKMDEAGNPVSFNFTNFIRFDRFGIYGIRGKENYIPKDEKQIRQDANFSLTWSGFRMRSDHSGISSEQKDQGYISIDSKEDFQVIDGNGKEKIKIGLLESGRYGIRIKDDEDNVSLITDQKGKLWLKKALLVGGEESATDSTVKIGRTGQVNAEGSPAAINANDKFIVYEDGSVEATKIHIDGDGIFTGVIKATGGTIGGLSIDQWSKSGYEPRVTSSNGTIFGGGNSAAKTTLTAVLYRANEIVPNVEYSWYKGDSPETGSDLRNHNNILEIDITNFGKETVQSYCCEMKIEIKKDKDTKEILTFLGNITLTKIADGITYNIESSKGYTFKDIGEQTTTLTARIYEGSTEIDKEGIMTYNWYTKIDDATDFVKSEVTTKKFECDFSKAQNYMQVFFTAQ